MARHGSSATFLEGCVTAWRTPSKMLEINQDLMHAAGEIFEKSSIFIDFGALFQQSGNIFCKMHPPKLVGGGVRTTQHPRGSMPVYG